MDIVHCAHEGMQFRTCLTTLLRLLLKPTQDMIRVKRLFPGSLTFRCPSLHPPRPVTCISDLPALFEREAQSAICLICAPAGRRKMDEGRQTGSHRGIVRAVVVTAVALMMALLKLLLLGRAAMWVSWSEKTHTTQAATL